MEYVALIGTVVMIHLLAVMSPGPDFIVAVRNSLMYSRRTGLWTAVGFGLGIGVHILYCAAGLAILISQSIVAFNIIKYLGAAYLIYIGLRSLLSKSGTVSAEDYKKANDISAWAAVKIGLLTNILNPKVTLFFLSLFTLVIDPNTPAAILGVMSIAMVINTILWFGLVAIFFTQERVVSIFNRYQKVFNKVLGSLLVALGCKVALSSQT